MVLTVEPGLYFQEDDLLVPEELRGIGIRIEDDILVTADGPGTSPTSSPAPRPTSRRGWAAISPEDHRPGLISTAWSARPRGRA